ncbi:MAG: hypothetical protein R3C59_25640 [Planctomycetaceae bacterium]
MSQVNITTGSRLHFGLLCGAPDSGWHYGGIGLMLDQPAWQLSVSRNCAGKADDLRTSTVVAERLRRLLADYRHQTADRTAVTIVTSQEVDFHTGLGSGTQLTLAVAAALLILNGQSLPARMTELATALGRSRRSAIGTFGFERGGFVVDHGRSTDVVQRISFPDEWRMVLLTPVSQSGLSGASEETFFGQHEFLAQTTVDLFDSLIRDHIIPSLQQRHFPTFQRSLAEYGTLVGQDYAAAQGGIYSHPLVRDVTDRLEQQGITGAVQSSWGPTVAIPAASAADAERIQVAVTECMSSSDMRVQICQARNSGATIRSTAPESDRVWA